MWKKEYNIIKDLVYSEQIYFINIMLQDDYREPPSVQTLEDWFQMYPDDHVPILTDARQEVYNWVRPTGYPTIILLNDKMELAMFSIRGWHDTFNYISNLDWSKEGK